MFLFFSVLPLKVSKRQVNSTEGSSNQPPCIDFKQKNCYPGTEWRFQCDMTQSQVITGANRVWSFWLIMLLSCKLGRTLWNMTDVAWVFACVFVGIRRRLFFTFIQNGFLYVCVCMCPAGAGLLQLVWAVWAGCGQQWELAQGPGASSIWTRTAKSATGPMPGEWNKVFLTPRWSILLCSAAHW